MSQSTLAKQIGISFQQLQKYELGTNRIGDGRLWTIAKIFKVPIGALYEGVQGAAGVEVSPIQFLTKRDTMRLVQAFDKIEDRALRKSIVVMVERAAAPIA
jgi:transcriptional regulator with XRE-family HTH domain